jgi:hypothetical protein
MSVAVLQYSLEEIEDIVFRGFDYRVPDDVVEKISNIAKQVGSPDYVKTPIFKKRENPMKVDHEIATITESSGKGQVKKRRGNKNMEVLNDEEWETNRTFQTTKIETKTGIAAEFDLIRATINKITDKNYVEMRNKIIDVIGNLVTDNSLSLLITISENIFDIASSNRYYSKIYAELYSDLSSKFTFIKEQYVANLKRFTEMFNNIEYVDSDVNYDKFCEINKINEKRKSLASFYINLMHCGVITKNEIVLITRNLLAKIYEYISLENKKNEVDELTETISILYKKDLYEHDDINYEKIEGFSVNEIVEKIANSKVKDYRSLSNKSLFKFMDLIDM